MIVRKSTGQQQTRINGRAGTQMMSRVRSTQMNAMVNLGTVAKLANGSSQQRQLPLRRQQTAIGGIGSSNGGGGRNNINSSQCQFQWTNKTMAEPKAEGG